MSISNNQNVITVWQNFLKSQEWNDLINDREPQFKLGPIIYTLTNVIDRPNESFSIVDMRTLKKEQISPHYHTNGETEIHFVLEGAGLMVVGGKEIQLSRDVVVEVPPDTAHYTVPDQLVLAVVNTPPFDSDNNVSLTASRESQEAVKFDYQQFLRLTS